MRNTPMKKTLITKLEFEKEFSKHNVAFDDHRAGNGRFAEKYYKDDVEDNNQTIHCCPVGTSQQK